MNKKAYKTLNKQKKQKIMLFPGENVFFVGGAFGKKVKASAAVNCCHGTYGEDGALQGVFEMIGLPYTSSDLTSSAVCMNKIIMKQLFEYFNFKITKWLYFERGQKIEFDEVEKKLGYPIFVKPANLGSSVGISKCESLQQLEQAVEVAFAFDNLIVIEQGVENLKEINCSVQEVGREVITSELEQPINWTHFLTYENKYLSKNKKGNSIVGGKMPKKLKSEVEKLSVEAYKKFFLSGVIRIDFLYDSLQKQLYINEINTIPGSLSFYLWRGKGITFRQHITNQIENAKIKFKQKNSITTEISSSLLDL